MAGLAGGRRNTPARSAKQVTRRDKRLSNPRVRVALEEIRQHNEYLDGMVIEGKPLEDHVHGTVFISEDPSRYACCGRIVPDEVLSERKNSSSEPKTSSSGLSRAGLADPPAAPASTDPTALPENGDGNGAWTLGQARSMLMQGYLLGHVVKMTGFGTRWFSDIPLRDGRGVSRGEWIDSL